jgi:hypothetical protein
LTVCAQAPGLISQAAFDALLFCGGQVVEASGFTARLDAEFLLLIGHLLIFSFLQKICSRPKSAGVEHMEHMEH